MEIIKIDDNQIKVSESKNVVEEKIYSYEYLLEMKANLEAEKVRVIGKIDEELIKVNDLLAECDRLGVKEKPVVIEPIEEVKEVIPK